MPFLLLILIALLIAQVGFWDALGAILGAAAMLVLFALLLGGSLVLAGYLALRRMKRRL